jgi:hypothetical protein
MTTNRIPFTHTHDGSKKERCGSSSSPRSFSLNQFVMMVKETPNKAGEGASEREN